MRLRTTRDVLLGVLSRWERQYPRTRNGDYAWVGPTRAKLKALDFATCSKGDVDEIIGNTSWTENQCSECEKEVPAVVEIGWDEENECALARLCPACVRGALAVVSPEALRRARASRGGQPRP